MMKISQMQNQESVFYYYLLWTNISFKRFIFYKEAQTVYFLVILSFD